MPSAFQRKGILHIEREIFSIIYIGKILISSMSTIKIQFTY